MVAVEAAGGYYQHGADADPGRAVWSFIEAVMGSRAIAAVVPMPDLLVLDNRARMNDPSTPDGNWGWRMPSNGTSAALAGSINEVAERYGRTSTT